VHERVELLVVVSWVWLEARSAARKLVQSARLFAKWTSKKNSRCFSDRLRYIGSIPTRFG